MNKKPRDPEAINVSFKPRIKTSGDDLVRVTIRQGQHEIELTKEQVHSLIKTLSARIEL